MKVESYFKRNPNSKRSHESREDGGLVSDRIRIPMRDEEKGYVSMPNTYRGRFESGLEYSTEQQPSWTQENNGVCGKLSEDSEYHSYTQGHVYH